MRHPLRAVTPSVQSQHIKHTRRSQIHNKLDTSTAKFYLLLPRSVSRPFPFPRLQTAQCLKPEENFHLLVTGPSYFHHLASKTYPSFSATRSHFHLTHFFESQHLPVFLSQISADLRLHPLREHEKRIGSGDNETRMSFWSAVIPMNIG